MKAPVLSVEDAEHKLKANVVLCIGPHQKSDKPTIEFYDSEYPQTAYGQFTGGGYYLETVLQSEDELRREGLDLHGGVPKWKLGPRAMNEVLDWVHQELQEDAR